MIYTHATEIMTFYVFISIRHYLERKAKEAKQMTVSFSAAKLSRKAEEEEEKKNSFVVPFSQEMVWIVREKNGDCVDDDEDDDARWHHPPRCVALRPDVSLIVDKWPRIFHLAVRPADNRHADCKIGWQHWRRASAS